MGRSSRLQLLLLLAAGALAPAACASRGASGVPAVGASTEREARVQPGDKIVLKIFQEEAMSDTFNVSEGGEAVLPRLGTVRASERSIAELRDTLRESYARYLRNPSVEITVLRRVAVLGEVTEPGIYLVDLTMTLRDVIAQAGGITDAGDAGKITIARGDQEIRFGKGGSSGFLTAELRSGDQVMVGQRPWIERNSLAFASTASVVISLVVPLVRELF